MGQNSRQTILTRVFIHIKHDWSARAAGIAGIGMAIFMAVVSIVTFMWPLLGIHRRLVQEKQLLLRESSQLLEVTIAELHGRVKAGELDSTNGLHVTMACLEIEKSMLTGIPTWPRARQYTLFPLQ